MPLERTFSRTEILARLRRTIAEGRAIVTAGASVGLVAKCAELGGADLIVVYSTGRSRIMGLPTTTMGDSNALTLGMYEEIANVVEDTPIIGGADAVDPTYMSLPRLVRRFRDAGFAGLINFPTIGDRQAWSAKRETVGLGFSREVEMIRLARSQDYFSMAYVFDVDEAQRMAAAGVDVQVAHVGWTGGGLSGNKDIPAEDKAAHDVQAIVEATLRENPECICLAHGGPLATPEDTERIYTQTDAQGFVGASSIERIPIERAVREAVEAFKAQHPRRKTGS